MKKSYSVEGHCDPAFAAVREAFAGNFEAGLEVGASCAVTVDGEYVVDLWGGYADAAHTVPWQRNTITNVYSTTKVMTTLCALMLVDRGQLDLDATVACYWPEFAAAGKDRILVRWLFSHSAGLSGFNEPLPLEALYDWERVTLLLENQEPWWEPGTRSGYHMLTFGYLLGELVRRISGKTLGSFFREEVALPLAADFHIGLSEEHDTRVAELIPPPPMELPPLDPESIAGRTLVSAPIMPAYSDRAWRGAEIPASNGHGNARSAARVGSVLACGGEVDGVRLLSRASIDRALEEQSNDIDLVLGLPIRWGLGFGLASEKLPGLSPRSFYWGGFGGSWLEMDPEARMSFSYVMNKLEVDPAGDKRMLKVRNAVFSAMRAKK